MEQHMNQKISYVDFSKLKEIKYKILIFILLIFSYFFYSYLASIYSEVNNLKDNIISKQIELAKKKHQLIKLKEIENKIKFFERNR
jgi:hypothetical protein